MKTLCYLLLFVVAGSVRGADAALREEAAKSLKRGVEFFRARVAVNGTYLWQYSEDLSKREGENKAAATQGWVQPPGTPSVGMAFMEAWKAIGDRYFLEAARETAHGLVRGQLRSGGWTYLMILLKNPPVLKKDGTGQKTSEIFRSRIRYGAFSRSVRDIMVVFASVLF